MELSVVHEFIGKELAGELTAAEQEVLAAWLAQASEEERAHYTEIRHYWRLPAPAPDPAATAAALDHLLARLDAVGQTTPTAEARALPMSAAPASSAPPAQPWRIRVAAALAGLAMLAGGYWAYQSTTPASGIPLTYQEQSTPRGATAKVLLADGTAVWLNADSHLWFPKRFTGSHREVYLEGEAFFQVKHNPNQPFLVHLGQEQIRVLGTSFNVRAYPDDETVAAAVVTGRVAFIRKARGLASHLDTQYVLPNHRAVYTKPTNALRQEATNSPDDAAWQQGALLFQDTPLGEVARTLARRYNVQVRLENEQLRACRLTGRFHDQTLREVVGLLSLTGAFGFELHDDQLLLTGPGCAAPSTAL